MTRKLKGFVFAVNGNSIECKLTNEAIEAMAHQGQCIEDVRHWVKKLRPYLDELPAELIRACLVPYGAWENEELADHEANLERFLWLVAGGIKEERQQQGSRKNNCWYTMEGY